MAWTKLAVAAAAAGITLTGGCTVFSPRESPLPTTGPKMTEVYRTHMDADGGDGTLRPRSRLPLRAADDDLETDQRSRLTDPLNNQFERLPNPDLTMHVFPHLAQGKYPIPGYVTVFPMYESVQYALPGEVAPRRKVGGSVTHPAPTTGRLTQTADTRSESPLEVSERRALTKPAKQP